MKHTLGKWTLDVEQLKVRDDHGRPIALLASNAAVSRDQVIANGHVIAAAADLLKACQAARGYGSQGETDDGISVSYLIDLAIRKANGES